MKQSGESIKTARTWGGLPSLLHGRGPGRPVGVTIGMTLYHDLGNEEIRALVEDLLPHLDRAALVAVRNAADARIDALDGAAEEAATAQPCGEPGCGCAEAAA